MNYQLVKCVFCQKISQPKDWRETWRIFIGKSFRYCPVCDEGDEGFPWKDLTEDEWEGENCPKCNQEIGWCRRGCPGP